MRIVDRDEMKTIDRITIEECGISGELLMENAGFEITRAFIDDYSLRPGVRIGVLCGGGNNGGDGFVVARLLKRNGFDPRVYLFAPEKKLSSTALQNWRRLEFYSIKAEVVDSDADFERVKRSVNSEEFIVDALLGIGFHGTPRGMIAQAIDLINEANKTVISVDTPSGIDANGSGGKIRAVRADTTYTVGLMKYGLLDFPAKDYCGRIRIVDIGFPHDVVQSVASRAFFIDASLADCLVPRRKKDSYKGTYGHLGILAGKRGYTGASLLAARAASRCGCGLVTVFSRDARLTKPDEIIGGYLPAAVEELGGIEDLASLFSFQNTLVVGPGMGTFKTAAGLMKRLLRLGKKMLIDADGLNNLAEDPGILKNVESEVVITPHIGEMSRLTGLKKEDVKKNKRKIALDFAVKHGVTVVLKDAVTFVSCPDGSLFVNDGGVSCLSKGGSGDVLAGIIGSLMARGLSAEGAAVAGVYLHTECGRIGCETGFEDCVRAPDLIEALPAAFKRMRSC